MRSPNCILPSWISMQYFIPYSVCFFLSSWKKSYKIMSATVLGIEIVHFGYWPAEAIQVFFILCLLWVFYSERKLIAGIGTLKSKAYKKIKKERKKKKKEKKRKKQTPSSRHSSALQLSLQKAYQVHRKKPAFF